MGVKKKKKEEERLEMGQLGNHSNESRALQWSMEKKCIGMDLVYLLPIAISKTSFTDRYVKPLRGPTLIWLPCWAILVAVK
jgi:hypothetical protein